MNSIEIYYIVCSRKLKTLCNLAHLQCILLNLVSGHAIRPPGSKTYLSELSFFTEIGISLTSVIQFTFFPILKYLFLVLNLYCSTFFQSFLHIIFGPNLKIDWMRAIPNLIKIDFNGVCRCWAAGDETCARKWLAVSVRLSSLLLAHPCKIPNCTIISVNFDV